MDTLVSTSSAKRKVGWNPFRNASEFVILIIGCFPIGRRRKKRLRLPRKKAARGRLREKRRPVEGKLRLAAEKQGVLSHVNE